MRVLVAYVSGFGATAEIAKEIARVLEERYVVDLESMVRVKGLEEYDAVVLGSSLRAGKWLGGIVKFMRRFRKELAQKPVAIFAVGLSARTREGSRRVLAESLPKLLGRYSELEPIASAAFGGVLHYDKYNLAIRSVMKHIAAQEGLPTSGFVDLRDWEAIRAWAEELSEKLQEAGQKQ